MKKISFIIILNMIGQFMAAQNYHAHTSWRNTRITQTDSAIAITTYGEQFYRTSLHDSILVTTELFPLHFIEETITSLTDLQPLTGLEVYPNPVRQTAHLQRKDVDDILHIEIMNINGNTLGKEKWNDLLQGHEVSFEHLVPGMYILLITNDQGTKASRFKVTKL